MVKNPDYIECLNMCVKKHPGFHPIDQQRCITECLDVPVTTGMIPFVPVPDRPHVIPNQPIPEVVVTVIDKIEEVVEKTKENFDLKDVLLKTVLTAGVVGAGLVILNAVSKGVGEGVVKKIGGD